MILSVFCLNTPQPVLHTSRHNSGAVYPTYSGEFSSALRLVLARAPCPSRSSPMPRHPTRTHMFDDLSRAGGGGRGASDKRESISRTRMLIEGYQSSAPWIRHTGQAEFRQMVHLLTTDLIGKRSTCDNEALPRKGVII